MPNKNREIARQTKREWYFKNREEILRRKRERRLALKLLNPPKSKPPKPPPTEEEKARKRELNRLACNRYRAKHLPRVRLVNRRYYHRHRDHIVQQQRDRRALVRQTRQNPSPFRKLRALADVCASRLLEADYGYTRIEPAPQVEERPREKQAAPKAVPTASQGLCGRVGTESGTESSSLP